MQMHQAQPQMISYIIGGAIFVLVLALRLRSVGRNRRLRLEWLWVVPAIFVALTALTFLQAPPTPLSLGLCGLALIVGGVLGWQRGRMMRIHVDPETHQLNQVTSPAAMIFLLVILALRFGARELADTGVLPVSPVLISQVLVAFALGMFSITRVEMFLRARRMLVAARAI